MCIIVYNYIQNTVLRLLKLHKNIIKLFCKKIFMAAMSALKHKLLYVHIHHIQSNIHLGNVMLYGLIPSIENINPLHVT